MKTTESETLSLGHMAVMHFGEDDFKRCRVAIMKVLGTCTNEELEHLMGLLDRGGINGCASQGERCCFFGTLARLRGVGRAEVLQSLSLDEVELAKVVSAVEYWFFQICSSSPKTLQHTQNNQFAFFAYEWCNHTLLLRTGKLTEAEGGNSQFDFDFARILARVMRRLAAKQRGNTLELNA